MTTTFTPLIEEGENKHFWENPVWREKEIKKIERNKKASEKRKDKASLKKFEEYLKSGRRTY